MSIAPTQLRSTMATTQTYDVALSFAGEDRPTAKKLADQLKHRGIRVFYDDFESSELWGKNLYEHLMDLYENRAQFCVLLVSKSYVSKKWPRVERKAAQARAFRQQEEYILPLRLDDTELPGLPATTGYVDVRQCKIKEVVDRIADKVRKRYDSVELSAFAFLVRRATFFAEALRDSLMNEFFIVEAEVGPWVTHCEHLQEAIRNLPALTNDPDGFFAPTRDVVQTIGDAAHEFQDSGTAATHTALSQLTDACASLRQLNYRLSSLGLSDPNPLPAIADANRVRTMIDDATVQLESAVHSDAPELERCIASRRLYLMVLYALTVCPNDDGIHRERLDRATQLMATAIATTPVGRARHSCQYRLDTLLSITLNESPRPP